MADWASAGRAGATRRCGPAFPQVEILWTLIAGRPVAATIEMVDCSGAKADVGKLTLKFTDHSGVTHTVFHQKDTFGCFDHYHTGETIPIRYVSSYPDVLLTQVELDDLPLALPLWALLDSACLAIPYMLLRYLAPFWRSPPPRLRYGR